LFDTGDQIAGDAVKMRMIVVMIFGRAVATQGVICFTCIVDYFMHFSVVAKSL
jgi:hypothetical protein